MITCPGCGGRNEPDARICEWCGRPFVAQGRQISPALVILGGLGVLALVLVAAAAMALITLIGALAGSGASPTPEVWPPAVSTPASRDTPTPTAAPETPFREPEFVRIANTGGTGAFIRQEPRTGARGIVAYPERTVLRIVGPDATENGRMWRQVEDRRGTRGWISSEYLIPSEDGF